MTERAAEQLSAITWLDKALTVQNIEYWLFGGWAVDFHAGPIGQACGGC